MGAKLDSTYIPDDMRKDFGVADAGWYVMDEKRRLIDGPYSTRKECENAIRENENLS